LLEKHLPLSSQTLNPFPLLSIVKGIYILLQQSNPP
jgi:hypothetical protein